MVVHELSLKEQSVEIVGCPAYDDWKLPASANFGNYPGRLALELGHDPRVLVELDAAEEMVRNAPLLLGGQLVRDDGQALVHLHRIGIYDLAVESGRQLDGKLHANGRQRGRMRQETEVGLPMGKLAGDADLHPICQCRSTRK